MNLKEIWPAEAALHGRIRKSGWRRALGVVAPRSLMWTVMWAAMWALAAPLQAKPKAEEPAKPSTAKRNWQPIKLDGLGRCQQTSLNWNIALTVSDMTSGRRLTGAEIAAEQVKIQVFSAEKPMDMQLEGDDFRLPWRTQEKAGPVKVRARIASPTQTVDGPDHEIFFYTDAKVDLLAQTPVGIVEGGCAQTAHCVKLDLGKSTGLWPGLALQLTRKKPAGTDGWERATLHLKQGDKTTELLRDKPVDLSYQPTQTLELCYAAPRCENPPGDGKIAAAEAIEIKPLHFCLSERDDECKKNPKQPGCDKPRAAVTLLVPEVQANSWLDCNLWWILIVAGVVVLIIVVVGVVTPKQFSSSAMIRVANNDRQLRREQGRPLRREPQGKRGFYRTAAICLTDIGTTVKKSQGHILQLRAGDKQIEIIKKGATLEKFDRNAWRPVEPGGTGRDVINERTLDSGKLYRVNNQYYFTVDF
jgi:hypothetical protein